MAGWENGLPSPDADEYGSSPYYNPPEPLEVFADVDTREADYEFEQVVVWRDKVTGELLGAADSGCSCPTPFGSLTREEMKPIRVVEDLDSLFDAVTPSYSQGVGLFREKIREALRA